MIELDSRKYYRAREQAEQQAAIEARCPEARNAHQQLAQAYARLLKGSSPSEDPAR